MGPQKKKLENTALIRGGGEEEKLDLSLYNKCIKKIIIL